MRAGEPGNRAKLMVIVGLVMALAGVTATRAMATHAYIEISVPIDTFVDADEGSVTELATAPVPEGFADHVCEVRAHAENQTSIHPGNDLLVESGDSSVLLPDVEAAPGQIVEAAEMLELGDVITVSLIMGEDGIFSAGIEVVVECFAGETTTTAAETTTTQEVAPTQVTTPTTEVPDTAVPSTAQTPTSIADEVLGTEVLPFTGPRDADLGLLALALLATGVLVVIGSRTRRADD